MRKLALLASADRVALATLSAVAGASRRAKQHSRQRDRLGRRAFRRRPRTRWPRSTPRPETSSGVVPIGRRPIGVTAPHGTGKVYTADERSNQLTRAFEGRLLGRDAHPDRARRSRTTSWRARTASSSTSGEYDTNTVGVVDTSIDETRRGLVHGQRQSRARRPTPSGSRTTARTCMRRTKARAQSEHRHALEARRGDR